MDAAVVALLEWVNRGGGDWPLGWVRASVKSENGFLYRGRSNGENYPLQPWEKPNSNP